jgi:hypothetical protein
MCVHAAAALPAMTEAGAREGAGALAEQLEAAGAVAHLPLAAVAAYGLARIGASALTEAR